MGQTDEATSQKDRTERMKGMYEPSSYLWDPETRQRDLFVPEAALRMKSFIHS